MLIMKIIMIVILVEMMMIFVNKKVYKLKM